MESPLGNNALSRGEKVRGHRDPTPCRLGGELLVRDRPRAHCTHAKHVIRDSPGVPAFLEPRGLELDHMVRGDKVKIVETQDACELPEFALIAPQG